jgi:diguanylate cyclase (GGDEF)-like protein
VYGWPYLCPARRGQPAVAAAIARTADRDADVARVGGDEFAVLAPGGADDAVALCTRLQKAIAGDGIRVTFGWVAYPADGEGPVELFRKADDRLFAAKMLTRNRHHVAPSSRAEILSAS